MRERLALEKQFTTQTDENLRIAALLVGDYIYEAQLDGERMVVTAVTGNFTAITGYTVEEMNAQGGWLTCILPEDRPKVQAYIEKATTGESTILDYRIRRKDGKVLWLRDFSQPVLDEKGNYIKSIGVSRNVTAEKEAELALQRKRKLLDEVLKTVPVGICISNSAGMFMLVNRTLEEISGYKAEELIGSSFLRLIPEEMQAFAKEAHDTFMNGDAVVTASELPIRRKDGTERWLAVSSRKFQREDGACYRVSAAQDITEKRQREQQMHDLLNLHARAEALAHIGSWEFDYRVNEFTKWSDELFRIYERPKELGIPNRDEYTQNNLSPETVARFIEWARDLIDSGEGGEIEIPVTTYRGNHKIVRIRATVVYDENLQPLKAVGLSQDITKEKLLEREKENLMRQLAQAQKMEAIGTLTSGVAHEFNNILAGMRGNTQLLAEKIGDNPKLNKYVQRLLELNYRAASIITQMMGFARQGKYEPKPLALKTCVDNVMKILIPTTDRRIRYHIEAACHVPLIEADAVQMEQVILNLAKNAVDAIEPLLGKEREHGHITFRIGYEPIDLKFQRAAQASTPMVVLEVRDNGMGIPKEVQTRIFEPFFTTKPVGKGTGLGLPMVYGIVKNHGGEIFVDSEVGKGTVFYLYFPPCEKKQEETKADTVEHIGNLHGTRVLVIDDEPVIGEAVRDYLSECGATVEVAENGSSGIEKFRAMEKENLVVVLDLNMPDKNGEQVLEEIRAIDKQAKIIIGTGYLGGEQTTRLMRKGAAMVLIKPYDFKDLAHTIEELMC